MDEKYVLVSLDDERSERLAEVLGNKTCKKILDLLTDKPLTGSEISRELDMPLNTVGYNVDKLMKAELIKERKHFWSVKGKRIPVYELSNKSIIISTKKRQSLKNLPMLVVAAVFTAFILVYENLGRMISAGSYKAVEDSALQAATTGASQEAAFEAFNSASSSFFGPLEWFLIIIWIAIIVFFVYSIASERRVKNG